MAKKYTMTGAVLSMNAKWGGVIYAEGEREVPEDSIEDLRDAGVLVEDEAGDVEGDGSPASASASVSLGGAQLAAVKAAIETLGDEAKKRDGAFKVAEINKTLAAAGAGFKVTAAQLASVSIEQA